MAKTKAQKSEIVSHIESVIKNAASSVFVHFTKVTVADETRLRRLLHADQVGYTVAKKSLVRIALTNLGMEHTDLPLEGEFAVAYNTNVDGDATLPANKIHTFAKELGGDRLVILGGVFMGAIKDAMHMRTIATIPSTPVLRGMFANIINSPRARFAIALSEVAKTKSV
jgi:large subunit ribosomal protein L10